MSTTSSKMIISQSNNKAVMAVAVVMAAVMILFLVTLYMIWRNNAYDTEYVRISSDMRVLAQEISTYSREASQGKQASFPLLDSKRKEMDQAFLRLKNGDADLPKLDSMLPEDVKELGVVWQRVNSSSETIISNRDRVLLLYEGANTLKASIPELQKKYDGVVDVLVDGGGASDQIAEAQRQTLRAERIARNIDKMLAGGSEADGVVEQVSEDAKEFGAVLNGMLNGDAANGIRRVNDESARRSLEEIAALFELIAISVEDMSGASPDLGKVRDSAAKIVIDAPSLMNQLTTLTKKVDALGDHRWFNTYWAIFFAVLLVVGAAFIGGQVYLNTRTRLRETAATNERNQQAIMRLLDELADLADGDLTTTATVTEDFTGAIADSINFTIDQLRILVSQINDTARKVSRAAEETQSTALHLAEASEHQAQEIAGASAAVNEMAVTIDQVSANAAESATVAERSVKIANRGAEVVQNTINGMDTIREQIQDTAKRIKRLGESSQEIGDIVSLINDIADQTNILALNAAIQASMAGDAGRGFAVVADEVQRLAERSSAATKQIEALVKTIQSDTNEAVISMEQTTAEVVRGARLAQDAGMALEEIERVSQELAELIQNISNAARQQAASAGHISNTMNVIQEITQQTNAGTTATARSIGNLADMATELRNSVEGFTLPEEAESDGDSEFRRMRGAA
jgi:twitching motility protein PilJ